MSLAPARACKHLAARETVVSIFKLGIASPRAQVEIPEIKSLEEENEELKGRIAKLEVALLDLKKTVEKLAF